MNICTLRPYHSFQTHLHRSAAVAAALLQAFQILEFSYRDLLPFSCKSISRIGNCWVTRPGWPPSQKCWMDSTLDLCADWFFHAELQKVDLTSCHLGGDKTISTQGSSLDIVGLVTAMYLLIQRELPHLERRRWMSLSNSKINKYIHMHGNIG